jgi:hypothetical protein
MTLDCRAGLQTNSFRCYMTLDCRTGLQTNSFRCYMTLEKAGGKRMPTRTQSRSTTKKPDSKSESAATGQTRRRSRRKRSGLLAMLELAVLTFWGRVILIMIVAALLASIDLLASNNRFDLFYRLAGIEMVLAAFIFWIRFMVRKA